MFPASKATTLESSNKSIINRGHQNSPPAGSGNADAQVHVRSRRDVAEEHASLSSLSVAPSVTDTPDTLSVDMHELITTTPFVDTSSLVHGVSSASTDGVGVTDYITTNYGEALVSNNTENSLIVGDLTLINNTSKQLVEMSSNTIEGTSDNHKTENKDNIDYDPSAMQGDSYPSIYAYGVQRLQFIRLLTKLKQANEELNLYTNESLPLSYDDIKSNDDVNIQTKQIETTTFPKHLTFPQTSLETNSDTDEDIIIYTTRKPFATVKHDVTTQSVTNTNTDDVETESSTSSSVLENLSTINPESKVSDSTTNPKHVLINLTISADGADDSSYKPLYSLTVTVPTAGDGHATPTVKITPIDAAPTVSTSFNNPTVIEDVNEDISSETRDESWGGMCECACPPCQEISNDGYDDYPESTTVSNIGNSDAYSTYSTENDNVTYESSTSDSTIFSSDTFETDTESDTESTITSTDFSDSTDLYFETSTAPSMTCICPKVEPPPILILEGEVIKFQMNITKLTKSYMFISNSTKHICRFFNRK